MSDIETYIQQFPDEVQEILQTIRMLINDNAPGANEHFAYGMPAYKLYKKPLVYFAAFKNHIGFYPTASGVEAVKAELVGFKFSKGAIQFPIDRALPKELIQKIVLFRLKEII